MISLGLGQLEILKLQASNFNSINRKLLFSQSKANHLNDQLDLKFTQICG